MKELFRLSTKLVATAGAGGKLSQGADAWQKGPPVQLDLKTFPQARNKFYRGLSEKSIEARL